MVCIPCLVVPALLFIWYRFLQPIFLRFWNPFGRVQAAKEEDSHGNKDKALSNGQTCPFSNMTKSTAKEEENTTAEELVESKKEK
ncbi:hypothetical protein Avbf_02008 [Armadillidium vulgare]|nr:hypothetical protein Avbf_02008 [Armadillidium vulgare]